MRGGVNRGMAGGQKRKTALPHLLTERHLQHMFVLGETHFIFFSKMSVFCSFRTIHEPRSDIEECHIFKKVIITVVFKQNDQSY